jgi:hypothetical protein
VTAAVLLSPAEPIRGHDGASTPVPDLAVRGDVAAYLRGLLLTAATEPGIDTAARHALLTNLLAPLGAEADRRAAELEEPAYWVRNGTHQRGADRQLFDAAEAAAYLTAHQFAWRGWP